MLSHELKNPLNLIHVKAELLTRTPEARGIAVVQEAAEAIQRSVVGQAKIIDDLLDLSRAPHWQAGVAAGTRSTFRSQ